jgi:hypothetical protein
VSHGGGVVGVFGRAVFGKELAWLIRVLWEVPVISKAIPGAFRLFSASEVLFGSCHLPYCVVFGLYVTVIVNYTCL